jgi:hypothetical protein
VYTACVRKLENVNIGCFVPYLAASAHAPPTCYGGNADMCVVATNTVASMNLSAFPCHHANHRSAVAMVLAQLQKVYHQSMLRARE